MIPYPKRNSEFDLQAELFSQLRSFGFDVKGEVIWRTGSSVKGRKICRFDLVVFHNNVAVVIIEVKRTKYDRSRSRQAMKYSSVGIPFFYCCGYDEIESTIIKCGKIVELSTGPVPW